MFFVFLCFACFEVFRGPEGFRKVREAGRIQILQDSSESDFMAPTYDEKTVFKQIKFNDY